MPTFAPGYLKPGAYLKQQDVSVPPLPAGVRVFTPIGEGAKTAPRVDSLIKGANGGQDGPLDFNTVIQITQVIDSNGIIYRQGIDYYLNRPTYTSATVDWSLKATLTGTQTLTTGTLQALNGQYLNMVINGGDGTPGDQQVLFSGLTSGTTPAQVAAFINAWSASLNGVASIVGGYLVLTAQTIQMNPGAALTTLGLLGPTGSEYQSASVIEPAPGTAYSVYYTSDKQASEYVPMWWTDPTALQNWYGLPKPQTVYATGTATSSTTGGEPFTMTDTAAAWTPNAFTGYYVRITGGTGQGQVRVIISNTATAITVSQDWNALSAPDATSEFTVTDINHNTISVGSLLGLRTGATVIIASQFADDIFSATEIQAAVVGLKQVIAGFSAYCLVYMEDLASTDTSVMAFILAQLKTQSNDINNQWCMAVFGLAQGNTSPQTFISLAEGVNSNRVVLMTNTVMSIDFGYGPMSLGGSAYAACHAGLICANEMAATPLLNRSIAAAGMNIATYTDNFTATDLTLMAAAGTTYYQVRGVDMVCYDALNTSGISMGNDPLLTDTVNTRNMDFI